MRLICTITDHIHENPYEFAYFLASQGIENDCEEIRNNSDIIFRIWIYEEDQLEKALTLYKDFHSNPSDPRYKQHSEAADRFQKQKLKQELPEEPADKTKQRRRFLSPAPYGPLSIAILIAVIALFMIAQIQRGTLTPPKIAGILQAPILAPVEKVLLFDYPTYFILRDKLFKIYSFEEIQQKQAPSKEIRNLIQDIRQTPVWMGLYERFLNHHRHPEIPLAYQGKLFEKISEGQVWRLITPSFLHLDLLHIFFNVLWFVLLGNQIEFRIGWWRYLLLILITGVISNTAQYLVSGPFFMGLSGIVVGMAAFIWARQQLAPWEGYLLQKFTLIFLGIFVIGMFLLQTVLLFLQIAGKFGTSIGIANTAHLTGGILGYVLGRLRFFAIQPKI